MRAGIVGMVAGALVGAACSLVVRRVLVQRAASEPPQRAVVGLRLAVTPEQVAQARGRAQQILDQMRLAEQSAGAWRPVYTVPPRRTWLGHDPAAIQGDDLPGDVRGFRRE